MALLTFHNIDYAGAAAKPLISLDSVSCFADSALAELYL